jgi:mevalonate kinase
LKIAENNPLKKTFYSNGKLLITGEYVVLDGAMALALPTKFGQSLIITESENKIISWKSYDADGSIWFESSISFSSIIKKERFEDSHSIKNTLIEILHEAYLLNSDFITHAKGYTITSELTFPKFWGLGTSSTLINNIAQWLGIDAYILLRNSFGGSGYDIACAQNNTAILYQLIDEIPKTTVINFKPSFKDKIHFVYLNKKQNSKAAIASYYSNQGNIEQTIPIINKITQAVIETTDSTVFENELQKHEIEMSAILEMQTVKEALFHDFQGTIKSLGAWGGDFVMVIANNNPTDYFKSKGYEIIISYEDMILE